MTSLDDACDVRSLDEQAITSQSWASSVANFTSQLFEKIRTYIVVSS
jgi:hypothetical protein